MKDNKNNSDRKPRPNQEGWPGDWNQNDDWTNDSNDQITTETLAHWLG